LAVLYCTIPHFAAALAQRDHAPGSGRPLILVGPEERVLDFSAEAEGCGLAAGMTARAAQARCPAAHLQEADVGRCRAEQEALLQLLETFNPRVEAHGWGAAYMEVDGQAAARSPVALCQGVGRTVRGELGPALQPALGWDSSKFTAQAAARSIPPGRLRAVERVRQPEFLRPLPVALLPLAGDVLQRLGFLGLRTLGQYGALPAAAVGQQFGRAGLLAHRCARGQDDRPVVPRWQRPPLAGQVELEVPLVERQGLVAALHHLVWPLLSRLRDSLQACGQVRLTVNFDDGDVQEQVRTFLFPLADEGRVVEALVGLLDRMQWRAAASALAVVLEQIQDAPAEQLSLFPLHDEKRARLQEVQRYLAARFGSPCLRRAVLSRPGAPLPEWRVDWLDEGGV
jgi:protein ImuB